MESSTKVSHNEHVYLDLRLCNYGIDNISALEKYILPNLTTLYISTNGINVNGCNVISKFLRSKEMNLDFLYLRSNGICDEGAEVLAKELSENATLTTLDLFHNLIGERGCTAFLNLVYDKSSIARAYNSNNKLTEIDFGHKPMTKIVEKLKSAPEINRTHKDTPKAASLKK